MFNNKIVFLALMLIAVGLEIFADIVLKKWSLDNRSSLLVLGIAIYTIGTIFWAFSLKYQYLSQAIVAFTVFNLLAVVMVGIIYFGEQLTVTTKIGIGLSIVSLILLEW